MSADGFFAQVVAETGLSRIFADQTVRKACARAGVTPEKLAPRDVEALIPHLRVALHLFLKHDEAEQRLRALASLSARGD